MRAQSLALVLVIAVSACGHGAQRVRVNPILATSPPRCLVVAPFENLSLTSMAGLGYSEMLASELHRSGYFAVLEPTALLYVQQALKLARLDPADPQMLRLLKDELGADGVVVGTLTEYWYTDDPQVYRDKQPSVAYTLRLLAVPSGDQLFQITASRTPGSLSGGLTMISEVAADLAEEAMAALGAELRRAKVKPMRGSPFAASCKFEELLLAEPQPKVVASRPGGGTTLGPALGGGELSPAAVDLVQRLKRNEPFVLAGVSFEYRETELRPEAKAALKPLGELLRFYPDLVIEVTVHTDNMGDPEELRSLTMQQAESVRKVLVGEHGSAERQIVVTGKGGDEPLLPNLNRRNRQINRRIELSLVTPPTGGW